MGNIVEINHKGSFKFTEKFLLNALHVNPRAILGKYGEMGVKALEDATPIRSGETAASWSYDIERSGRNGWQIVWYNSNVNNHVNIAVILQYGHLTGTGGWVDGIDYINPALEPVFDKIANEAWKEVYSV